MVTAAAVERQLIELLLWRSWGRLFGHGGSASGGATAGSVAAIGRVGTFFFRLFGMPTPSFGPISALCTLQHFVHCELGVWCWTMHWEGLDGSGWRRVGHSYIAMLRALKGERGGASAQPAAQKDHPSEKP